MDHSNEPSRNQFACSVCKTTCFNELNFDRHLIGKKHTQNLLEAFEKGEQFPSYLVPNDNIFNDVKQQLPNRDSLPEIVQTEKQPQLEENPKPYGKWQTMVRKEPRIKIKKIGAVSQKKKKAPNSSSSGQLHEDMMMNMMKSMSNLNASGDIENDPIMQQFMRVMESFCTFSKLRGSYESLDPTNAKNPDQIQQVLVNMDLTSSLQTLKSDQGFGFRSSSGSLTQPQALPVEVQLPEPKPQPDNKDEDGQIVETHSNNDETNTTLETLHETAAPKAENPTKELLRKKINILEELLQSIRNETVSEQAARSRLDVLKVDNEQPSNAWDQDYVTEENVKLILELRQQKKQLIDQIKQSLVADNDIEVIGEFNPNQRGPGIFAQSRRQPQEVDLTSTEPEPEPINPLLLLTEVERDESYQKFLTLTAEAIRLFDSIPPYVFVNMNIRPYAIRATLSDFASGSLYPDDVDSVPISSLERKFIKFIVRHVNFQNYPDLETALYEFLALEGMDPRAIMGVPTVIAHQSSAAAAFSNIDSVKQNLMNHMSQLN